MQTIIIVKNKENPSTIELKIDATLAEIQYCSPDFFEKPHGKNEKFIVLTGFLISSRTVEATLNRYHAVYVFGSANGNTLTLHYLGTNFFAKDSKAAVAKIIKASEVSVDDPRYFIETRFHADRFIHRIL